MTTRAAVIQEALSWIGTPFHDCSCVKGAGVDCVNLTAAVFMAVGLVPRVEIPSYKPQWFEHRDEPLFLHGIASYAHQVNVGLAGDIAMFNYGRHAAHAGILVDERTIVHAFKPMGFVTKASLTDYLQLPSGARGSLHSFWSVFP